MSNIIYPDFTEFYFRTEYGRYAGRCQVTRWCLMKNLMQIVYVEKRVHKVAHGASAISWRIGVCMTNYHPITRIRKSQYYKAMKEAKEAIGI